MTKILIVEDNEMNRDMLSRRLVKRGYEIVLAFDGAAGVEMAQREKPDLILMDLGLPVMDGWAATRYLKQDPNTRGIPVIALTAHAMAGDQRKALEAGCDDYDTKPVDIKRLIPKIEELLLKFSPATEDPSPAAQPVEEAEDQPTRAVAAVQAPFEPFTSFPPPLDPPPSHPEAGDPVPVASPQWDLSPLDSAPRPRTRADSLIPTRPQLDPPRRPLAPIAAMPSATDTLTPDAFSLLLVDDNPENRDMLSRRLLRQGYRVTLAEDGYHALSQMQRTPFDLVLLDVMMPGLNGFEVLAEIRKTYSPSQVSVVMVTAKGESQDVVQALQLGANDYITKPVDFPVALARIQTQLGLLEASRRNSGGINREEEDLLKGRYRVERLLASGGFGQTYLAADTHRPGHPICVVKQLRTFDDEPGLLEIARRLFTKEAETLERLKHDQIPQLLAYFEDGSEFYLVQEYIEGKVLSDLLSGQSLPESKVVVMLLNLLKVMHYIHQQQVIHRDIKPQNIIRRQDNGKLVLIDFGAVKEISLGLTEGRNHTVSIGSLGFTPLEQLAGRPRPNSDIFAAGMVAIQALTGVEPRELAEDMDTGLLLWQETGIPVSPEFAAVLDHMIARDALQRYQTAIEVARDLRTIVVNQLPPKDPNTQS